MYNETRLNLPLGHQIEAQKSSQWNCSFFRRRCRNDYDASFLFSCCALQIICATILFEIVWLFDKEQITVPASTQFFFPFPFLCTHKKIGLQDEAERKVSFWFIISTSGSVKKVFFPSFVLPCRKNRPERNWIKATRKLKRFFTQRLIRLEMMPFAINTRRDVDFSFLSPLVVITINSRMWKAMELWLMLMICHESGLEVKDWSDRSDSVNLISAKRASPKASNPESNVRSTQL